MAAIVEMHIAASVPEIERGEAAVFVLERTGNMGAAASTTWQCLGLTGVSNFDPWDATRILSLPTFEAATGEHEVTVTLIKASGATIVTPTATIAIKESGGTVPVPPEPVTPTPEPKPDAKRPQAPPAPQPGTTRNVPEDYPSVMAAYQDAPPGTTISVKTGVNCGELKFNRNMDPKNPVIIRSRQLLGAILDKRVVFTGQGHWLHGFRQTYKTTSQSKGAIDIDADFLWLTRLEIQSQHGINTLTPNRADIRIGWCTFTGKNTSAEPVSNIYLRMPVGNKYKDPSDGPRRIYIYRNDFDDDAPRSNRAMEDHCIYFGDSKCKGDDMVKMLDVEIDHNLIRESNKRVRGLYVKRGFYAFQNSFLGCKYNWGLRVGANARIEGNTCRGSAKLVISGHRCTIINNSWGEGGCDLYAGATRKGGDPIYMAADYTELDMNEGPLRVGYMTSGHNLDNDWGGKVDHVTIWQHTGKITKVAANIDEGTYVQHNRPKEGTGYLPRVPLTPADVGVAGSI